MNNSVLCEKSILAQQAIEVFQQLLDSWSISPNIHFELEGTCAENSSHQKNINFNQINKQLCRLGVFGEVKDEYWKNQWEYVSLFKGQSPLKEAQDLAMAIAILPQLFKQQGFEKTYIKPVSWSGDNKRLLSGGKNVFSAESKSVHIPNAIQINISAKTENGTNLIPKDGFGETLQNSLLKSSYHCCLLFLPEEEAFQRLQLKSRFSLDEELSSPCDISGGHQGSIALYKELGKHNQPMGQTPLLLSLIHI